MTDREWFQMAVNAFKLMTTDEQLRVVETMAELQYKQASDRFFEAVYRQTLVRHPQEGQP